MEGWRLVVARLISSAPRGGPILILRVVKAKFDTLLLALNSQVANRVPMEGRCINDIERVRLRIKHGKTVVVLRCDDDLFHPG